MAPATLLGLGVVPGRLAEPAERTRVGFIRVSRVPCASPTDIELSITSRTFELFYSLRAVSAGTALALGLARDETVTIEAR